jgi:Lipoprotein amino terminal region
MLYDHTQTAEQSALALRETQETFQQLCQHTSADIRPEVPALFIKVVQQMKRLDAASLRQLMSTVKGSSMCTKAEKFYRDALPLLGTGGAISTMRQLIGDNQATDDEVEVWMSAMAFIKNPTKEMMTELKVNTSPDEELLLA